MFYLLVDSLTIEYYSMLATPGLTWQVHADTFVHRQIGPWQIYRTSRSWPVNVCLNGLRKTHGAPFSFCFSVFFFLFTFRPELLYIRSFVVGDKFIAIPWSSACCCCWCCCKTVMSRIGFSQSSENKKQKFFLLLDHWKINVFNIENWSFFLCNRG